MKSFNGMEQPRNQGSRGLEKAGADAVGNAVKVEESEKVDGLEFAVNRGRAAEASRNLEIRAEQPWRRRDLHWWAIWMALMAGLRFRLERRLGEIFFLEDFVKGRAFRFVLGGQRAAADEVARVAALRVTSNAFPQHVQHSSIAVILMNTGAAKLENLAADFLERRKVKKAFAVIAEIAFGAIATLHAIGADKFSGAGVVDHQMVADEIETVAIEAGLPRSVQAFAKLTVEDKIAKTLALDDIVEGLRQTHAEEIGGGERVTAAVFQDSGISHGCSLE